MVAAEASAEEEVTKSGDPQNAATAAHAVLEEQMEGGASSSAAQPDVEGINAEHLVSAEQPATGDHCEREEEHAAEAPNTKGLMNTTSAHDDWLRRGPFLYHLDFHTYVRYVHRVPRPRKTRNEGRHRRVPLFLFDSHYVLAQQYVQELDVQGQCNVVVLEALKCPSPDLNNGEDNSAF